MNAKTLQLMRERFNNKVCTIFTKPINRTFTDATWREHFAIRVLDVGPDGVWGQHPYNGTMSFFRLEEIVFIQEEIELDPNNPDHVKMIREYEKQSGKKILSDVSPHLAPTLPEPPANPLAVIEAPVKEEEPEGVDATFVNIDVLEKLAAGTKRTNDLIKFTKLHE